MTGLTDLLNHTRIKEQLGLDVLRAQRQAQPLAVALIDLDLFKSVNDRYGHAPGDRVVTSLAHLLRKRLRKTDLIGRYGSEEFATIFPSTQGATAVHAMNHIREADAHVRQRAEGGEFVVTLSAGVAAHPGCAEPAALTDAADKALYGAKRSGRNQVMLAAQWRVRDSPLAGQSPNLLTKIAWHADARPMRHGTIARHGERYIMLCIGG